MSTKINDIANTTQVSSASDPAARTSTVTGTGVDFLQGDGQCFAVQHVGAVSGTTPTLDGKIQESDTSGSGYADISGATFTQVTASTSLLVINFFRTKRYLRYVGTIGGTTPSFTMAVQIGELKKSVLS
jgi:hypothetical protein